MEFSRLGNLHDLSLPVLFGKWNGLPTLEGSPFPDLDSPWKNGHNPFSPLPSTFEPQAIRPTQLHAAQWSPTTSNTTSPTSATTSRTSANESWQDSIDPTTNEYRPRGPTGKRKASVRRITPKSKKHAHELSRNRTAATKYRNRQKTYVDGLQEKCKDAEMQMQVKLSMVQSLRDELFELRRELLRHSSCGDSKVKDYSWGFDSAL